MHTYEGLELMKKRSSLFLSAALEVKGTSESVDAGGRYRRQHVLLTLHIHLLSFFEILQTFHFDFDSVLKAISRLLA